ncbi:hypothetical protein ACGF12_10850 [Kitasatospora sp. NPDC048296]|uniref:hypothetical protein n=1 Tax=Kitasatospora sp. NPDC048296 TaxID=3364048 RepID=UPI00371D5451
MTERRRLRRRWLAAGLAAVVLAAAGVGWWWRSGHAPAELPASACWSVLTRADLEPLAADQHGTFVEDYSMDYGGGLHPTPDSQTCDVRNAEHVVLSVHMRSVDEFTMEVLYGAGSKVSKRPLDFGADVQGWVEPEEVSLALRCDNPENTRIGRPYVRVVVNTYVSSPMPDRSHRAILDILLKYAKAVVASYPCSNPLHLPDSVPESATNFPSPNH